MSRPRKIEREEKVSKPADTGRGMLVEILSHVIGSHEYIGIPTLSEEERLAAALKAIFGHKEGRVPRNDDALLQSMFQIIQREKVSVRKAAAQVAAKFSEKQLRERNEISKENMRDRLAAKYSKSDYKSYSAEIAEFFEDYSQSKDAHHKRIVKDFIHYYSY